MLHEVALFMQNAFEYTLQGSKLIMRDVHNKSHNRSKSLLVLWNLFTLVNKLSLVPRNVLCNNMTLRLKLYFFFQKISSKICHTIMRPNDIVKLKIFVNC